MTKTTMEQLNEAIEKAHGMRGKLTQEISASIAEFSAIKSKIQTDRTLSPNGKREKIEKEQEHHAEKFFLHLQDLRSQYEKEVKAARKLALETMAKGTEEPKDKVTLTLFERDLKSLRTSVMLDLTPATAIKKIEDFSAKYNDTYYVEQLANVFGELSQNIIAMENTLETRKHLGRVFESVQAQMMTDEKKSATEALAYFNSAESKPFFVNPSSSMAETNPHITGLKQVVGAKYIQYINDPQKGLEAIDPTYETFVTT